VTKLDRLARSTQHLLEIADFVKRKGADLESYGEKLVTS
jgi:DNA invertase Pin-like site-specific DNA recombinase